MLDAKVMKDEVSLVEIIEKEAKIKLTQKGYNTCPICKGKGKVSVVNDKVVKCFRGSCPLNKAQDVYGMLMLLGVSSTFKEALNVVSKYTGRVQIESISESKNRSSILKQTYELYRNELYRTKYLESRGLEKSVLKSKVGYAPDEEKYLIRKLKNINPERLREEGLIGRDGNDVMRNRIVFPICSVQNEYIHLQGRSLDPDAYLRWLCTSTMEGKYKSNMNYTYNIENVREEEVVFLTEGVTDGLSLMELGLPAVSCFGLKPSLINEIEYLSKLRDLVCIFDNDKHEVTSYNANTVTKSWSQVLPILAEIKILKPEIRIWCVEPPAEEGIKDINEWLINGLTREKLEEYCEHRMKPLINYYIKYMGIKNAKVVEILRASKTEEAKKLFQEEVEKKYNSWLEYIMEVI